MNTMVKHLSALAALGLLISSPSASASVVCIGTVNTSWIDKWGNAHISASWGDQNLQICNVERTWKDISPTLCLSWVAMANSAVSMGRELRIQYDEESDCANIPAFADSPVPRYLMLL